MLVQNELRQLGDFQIIREVGRGGMGVVYEAEQVSLGRRVALKMLPNETLLDPKQKLRFEREARAAAKLHHSNIVPVFGVGTSEGQLYYVMQYIQGMALNDVLDELRKLHARGQQYSQAQLESDLEPQTGTRSRAEASIGDVAKSLLAGALPHFGSDTPPELPQGDATIIVEGNNHAAPEKVVSTVESPVTGSVSRPSLQTDHCTASNSSISLLQTGLHSGHRNLRQPNYFGSVAQMGLQVARALEYAHSQGVLHRDIKPSNLVLDLKGTVWVTDFGLAKLDDDRGLTQAGDILGTLRYMSPEAFKGKSDQRSEVYSLGLTLYELLAYRPAFNERVRSALIDQVMSAQVEPLKALCPQIPNDLDTIIRKAIERDPEHRYQSAGELADDLQRFLEDNPIKARRISLFERLGRWSRRNKGLSAALATVTLLISLLAVGSTIAAGYFGAVNSTLKTTVSKLETTQKTLNEKIEELRSATDSLTTSRNDAQRKATDNLRLAQEAEVAKRESLTTLSDMQADRGVSAMTQGDYPTAMLWFSDAALNSRHDPRRESANRLRARNVMNVSWIPVGLLSREASGRSRLSFQPDGDLLLDIRASGRFQIWNWHLERSLPWTEEIGEVLDVVWNADGSWIAIAAASGHVQIRSVPEGKRILEIQHPSEITCIAWSPQGNRLAIAGDDLRIWDMRSEPRLEHICPHPVRIDSIKFNQNGNRTVTADHDGVARVYGLGVIQQELKPLFDGVPHRPNSTLAPVFVDGDQKFVTLVESRINCWQTDTGEAVEATNSLPQVPGIMQLVASPDGKWVAAGNNQALVFNLTGDYVQLRHPNAIRSITFSPDSSTLTTGCDDWMARMWKLPHTDGLPQLIPQLQTINSCVYSANGDYLAVCGEDSIRIWRRPQTNIGVRGFAGWKERFIKPRASFDGKWIAPGKWHELPQHSAPRSSLTVIELQTQVAVGPQIDLEGIIDSCLCRDPQRIAIASLNGGGGQLSIYNVLTGTLACPPLQLPGIPVSVAARSEIADVAVMCKSGHVWSVNSMTGEKNFEVRVSAWENETQLNRLAYSPDGKRLVILTHPNTVEVRDAQTGAAMIEPIHPAPNFSSYCNCIAFSPDSRWLATGINGDSAVQVWDLMTGKPACKSLPHPGDVFGIFAVAFSSDSRLLMTGNKDGRARIWDWQNEKLAVPPLQHADEVLDVAFTTNGQYAITALRNGYARVWDLATGSPIAPRWDYPLPTNTSTDTLCIAGDWLVLGALNYPIVNLSGLLSQPTLSPESQKSIAELVTGQKLELGAPSGVSPAEWRALWENLRTRELSPQKIAEDLAIEIDKSNSTAMRMMIVDRAAERDDVLKELVRLRDSVPEVYLALTRKKLRSKDHSAEIYRQRAIMLFEAELQRQPDEVAVIQQLVELYSAGLEPTWQELKITAIKSAHGAQIERQPDGAYLVSGNNIAGDQYIVDVDGPAGEISAIRLEVLPDASLPNHGHGRHPTGNFQMTEFRTFQLKSETEEVGLPLKRACASYTYPGPRIDVRGLIDPEHQTLWHVFGRPGQRHFAVLELESPATLDSKHVLRIKMQHLAMGDPINLGCFRLSASADKTAFDKERVLAAIRSGINVGRNGLAAIYMLQGKFDIADRLLEGRAGGGGSDELSRLLLLIELDQIRNRPESVKRHYEDFLTWLQRNPLPNVWLHRVCECLENNGGINRAKAWNLLRRWSVEREIKQAGTVVVKSPEDLSFRLEIASRATQIGDWKTATDNYLAAVGLSPENRMLWIYAGSALMISRDTVAMLKFRERLIKQFAGTSDPDVAETVCKLALLIPDQFDIKLLPTELLFKELEQPANARNDWYISVAALIQYRKGKYQEAIDFTKRLGDTPVGQTGALGLFIQSMSQQRLGNREQSRKAYQQGVLLIPPILIELSAPDHDASVTAEPGDVMHDWQIAEVLRREAKQLLDEK